MYVKVTRHYVKQCQKIAQYLGIKWVNAIFQVAPNIAVYLVVPWPADISLLANSQPNIV